MKEDWTDTLEKKLEGYSMEEPEGLWSAIQSSLPAAPAPVTKVHRLRNIFAVAVPSAAAAVLAAWLLLPGGNDVQLAPLPSTPVALSEPQLEPAEASEMGEASELEEMISMGNLAALVAQETSAPRTSIAMNLNTVEAVDETPLVTSDEPEAVTEPAPEVEERIFEPPFPAYAPPSVDPWPYEEVGKGRSSQGSRVSMNLGGASNAQTGLHGDAVMLACEDATMLKSDPENWNAAEALRRTTGEYHWGISWRVNALAEKYITDRISVGTGLSWTMVEGAMEYDLDRAQVNYMGVPVMLGADLVDKGGFAIGVSVGATAAWGLPSSSSVPVNGIQLSSTAGLNARYRIHGNLALQLGFAADTFYKTGKRATSIFQEPTTILNGNLGLVFSLR